MRKVLLTTGFLLISCVFLFTASAKSTYRSDFFTSLRGPADSLAQKSLTELPPHLILDSLISCAKNYLGVPYRSGGYSSKGFDCSGFTSFVFSHFGFRLPRTSYGQATVGKTVTANEVQKGDLIFFKGRNSRSKSIGHVGIVISDKGEKIKFIHASVNNGISIETIDSKYYRPRFVKSVRLVDSLLPLPEICTPAGISAILGDK